MEAVHHELLFGKKSSDNLVNESTVFYSNCLNFNNQACVKKYNYMI